MRDWMSETSSLQWVIESHTLASYTRFEAPPPGAEPDEEERDCESAHSYRTLITTLTCIPIVCASPDPS